MTTVPVHRDVHAFVVAVRAELADLPPEDVDELTSGLEADLVERFTDAPGEPAVLDDPVAYAAELRSAAGLPAQGPAVPERARPGLWARPHASWAAAWGRYVQLLRSRAAPSSTPGPSPLGSPSGSVSSSPSSGVSRSPSATPSRSSFRP